MATDSNTLYRMLPQLGETIAQPRFASLLALYPRELVADALRTSLEAARREIQREQHTPESLSAWISSLHTSIARDLTLRVRGSLQRVINATGVLLQTNLGRAPLSEDALHAIAESARGYCNLEFDIAAGARGKRDVHAEDLLLGLLALRSGVPFLDFKRTHAAAVVNNCAAATFLVLNTLAQNGEVIVSRGELVEIGGGFRVPDILQKSGAVLREIGTTNRTRIRDYADAITPETKLILRVHRSNFRIEGFTEQPSMAELIALGAQHSIPVFEDQGTGCVVDLADAGVRDQPSWIVSAIGGVDVVACSGDKLLGGPQCGIITGRRALVEQVRSNPLYRAMRVDKLTYAALTATLQAYSTGREDSIPVVAMLRASSESLRKQCEALAAGLAKRRANVDIEVVPVESVIGGGTSPGATLPSFAVALRCVDRSEAQLAAQLRAAPVPVVARTQDGRVLLDLRTVLPADEEDLLRTLLGVLEACEDA